MGKGFLAIGMIVIGLMLFVAGVSGGQPLAAKPTPFKMVQVQPANDGRIWFSYNEFQEALVYFTGLTPNHPSVQYTCQPDLGHDGMYTTCLVQLQGNLFDVTRQNGRMQMLAHE